MKSRVNKLVERAIAATVAAIEIYNKPDFKYRTETFCILAINGWELLLKAKCLCENGNKIQSLYVKEPRQKKDGTKSKLLKIKHNRSGNPCTHSLDFLIKRLLDQKFLDKTATRNLEVLQELRNSSVHFYNQSSVELATRLQEIGAASLKNFVLAVQEWFEIDLSKFNFYLMPLSFVDPPQRINAVVLNKEERIFLDYLKLIEKGAQKTNSEYTVTVNIDVKFTRSKSKGGVEVRPTRNPDAPEVQITEEQIREKYPWSYSKLTKKCAERYSDFKIDNKFHRIKRALWEDKRFAHVRYLNPNNKKSSSQRFYNPNILQVMDKHYTKKQGNR